MAIELLVISALLAFLLVRTCFKGRFIRYLSNPVDCFATGTWVAATAVLAVLLDTALPEWHPLSVALGVLSVALLLCYLPLVAANFRLLMFGQSSFHNSHTPIRPTGRVLLSTVSVQSVVIMGVHFLGDALPAWLAFSLVALGYVLYILGFAVTIQRYLRQRGWTLAEEWDNTNCILHGALSISVLAAVSSAALPQPAIEATWLCAAILFLAVEAIEIARTQRRVQKYGLRRGILTYSVSQWARNFTFGMFYAATLNLYGHEVAGGAAPLPILGGLHSTIIAWGQYVVLFFLLAETVLFLTEGISHKLTQRAAHSHP
jgi:hypothetical protein